MRKIYTLLIGALLTCGNATAQDYTKGVFVLNEDWYGHNNSTLNFWNPIGNYVDYYIMQLANNYEYSLGCTAQYGQIYGDRIIVMSKQDRDPGESGAMESGRITLLDKNSLKAITVKPIIQTNDANKSIADGRACLFVNDTKAYIGTSNGIFIMDLDSYNIDGRIDGTENPLIVGGENNADGIGPLYNNQMGVMLRTQDYVFAIKQDKGVLVIDPQKDVVVKTIEGCFSTMVQSKDGNIWTGMNISDSQSYPYGNNGDDWVGSRLMCIDQYSLETKTVDLKIGGVPQSWYAWTAGTLTASNTCNHLYFVYTDPSYGQDSWFRNSCLYRYDIDKNECELIYESEVDGLYFYGGAIQCNPVDGNIYAALYVGENIATQNWVYMILDKDGKEVASYQPIENYWYPAMFIFPDNESPVVEDFDEIIVGETPVEVALSDKVKDADTPVATIVKRISDIGDPSIIKAEVINGNLLVTALDYGETSIDVEFNSNGKKVTKTVEVTSTISAIETIDAVETIVTSIGGELVIKGISSRQHVAVYNSQGMLIKNMTVENDTVISDLDKGHLYIVRINNLSFKIIL